MNILAARIVGAGLLKGAFDVFDAMLSCTFQFDLSDPESASEETLEALMSAHPVSMQGTIQKGAGAISLLFTVQDAAHFSALIQEKDFDPETPLSDDDRSMLKEIADPALGGGVSNLMERFGQEVVPLEDVQVVDTGTENLAALIALVGEEGTLVSFTFTNNADISGEGVAVFSESLEALVPESELTAANQSLATEAELSPDEMSDILSGFGSDTGGYAVDEMSPAAKENLDMVLDIGLTATARLGRVEMPLGEILSLGPGSIVEVGHLVDEPVDLLVNGKLIARGDVVVVDEKFGLRITEIVSTKARIESLR